MGFIVQLIHLGLKRFCCKETWLELINYWNLFLLSDSVTEKSKLQGEEKKSCLGGCSVEVVSAMKKAKKRARRERKKIGL